MLFYNFTFAFLIEGYLEFSISTFINLYDIKMNTYMDHINNLFTIFMIFMIFILLIYVIVFLL